MLLCCLHIAAEAYGTAFFYCGIMFQFVILLYNICQEKDLYLRRGLATINLKARIPFALCPFSNAH